MLSQRILISTATVTRYQQAFGLDAATLPGTFLLTLWQYFKVPELAQRDYLLIQQQVQLQQPLTWPSSYVATLQRTAILPKKHAAIWIYHLIVWKEGQQFADCETRIYVRPVSNELG
jgi:hypothetical protein